MTNDSFSRSTSLGVVLRSFIFYALVFMLVFVFSFVVWILPPLTRRSPWHYINYFGSTINFLLLRLCKIRIQVQGHPPKKDQPALIIANHTGMWETVGLFPYVRGPLIYVIKKQLISWKYNFFSLGVRTLDFIAISRDSNAGDFKLMVDSLPLHLERKHQVLIFPGGTRTALPKSIQINAGGMLLAKKVKCAVQPLFINSETWSRGRVIKEIGFLYPGTIQIKFGKLIPSSEISGNKVRDLHQRVLDFFESSAGEK